jgi:hypothetical protein
MGAGLGKEVGRIEILGSGGYYAHLFTFMTLQTPNSIYALELEGG